MVCPVRRFWQMRVHPQCKNVQFTVISLSLNVTNSRKHFHFCIIRSVLTGCVKFKIPNERRRGGRLIYTRHVRLGARAKYDIIAVMAEVCFGARNVFSRGGVHDIFSHFPRSSASEDERVLGNSSRTCMSVPAFVWNRSSFQTPSGATFNALRENNAEFVFFSSFFA